MKKTALLVFILGCLSVTSGWLLSKASLVGRAGISLFYKEYRFLKTWWKGALAVFVVWMIVLIVQTIVEKKLKKGTASLIHVVFILLALLGLYFTYSDFQHTTSHRWLKEKFHIGAYLFWLGWIIVSVFCMVQKRKELPQQENELPAELPETPLP